MSGTSCTKCANPLVYVPHKKTKWTKANNVTRTFALQNRYMSVTSIHRVDLAKSKSRKAYFQHKVTNRKGIGSLEQMAHFRYLRGKSETSFKNDEKIS